ncbi:hypothetical protein ACFWDA_14135 [Rhodococcus zopfii]|uniref:hypothetical protein n=1 Tax=Rhodococcus zopfii TaxID=43772 RepID=UPI000934430F|nr:hypothetical protein [Rhodococcus zopfii]
MSIEIGDLDAVARHLAAGADGINELGSESTDLPDAGASTALLAESLGALASALDLAVRSLANAADLTRNNLRDYRELEALNTQNIAQGGER